MKDNEVSLREYLDARITAVEKAATARAEAQDKSVSAALAAAQAAVQKAESASEKRFESVNEFRSTLADQARLLMPRNESEALHNAARERNEGAFAAMNERLTAISARVAAFEAQGEGKKMGWASIVSVIAVITSVAGLVLMMFNLKD